MLHAYVFGPIAVIVRHWVQQRAGDTESGARIEVRRVEYEEIPGDTVGLAGLRLMPLSRGIWRADLFRNQDGETLHHHHPRFESGNAGERYFDDRLTAEPVEFVLRKLADLRTLLVEGAADIADGVNYADVDRALPLIRQAIERSFEPVTTAL